MKGQEHVVSCIAVQALLLMHKLRVSDYGIAYCQCWPGRSAVEGASIYATNNLTLCKCELPTQPTGPLSPHTRL